MPEPRIHYAGALRYSIGSGKLVIISGGWAACCSGQRARRIRERGQHTYDQARVTCALCLKNITRSQGLAP
jgi:hypothetical protein